MTPSTLATIRAALRATATPRTTLYALALRAAIAALYRTLPPADETRCARDLLDAARSPAGYTYGPTPAAHPRWDNDPAGYARQETEHAPPDDVTAAMAALVSAAALPATAADRDPHRIRPRLPHGPVPGQARSRVGQPRRHRHPAR